MPEPLISACPSCGHTIREHTDRARANALREMANEADMAINDEMQPEYPGREVAKWLRKRADRIEAGRA